MHFGRLMNIQVATRRADRVVKGIAEKLDILGLNYGRHRYHKELRDNPERMIVGSETYIDDLPFNWEYVKNNNAFIGDFCWVAIDYIGETGIGYWSYPSYKGLPILTGSGAIDLIGYPNAENGFQQVVWGLSDRPYIGVRPVTQNNERPVKKAWRFTNALPSWNWQGCEGKRAVIEVFSTGYRIELFCNGQSIGSKRIKEFRTKFTTRYIPGNIEAVAYDESGAVIGRSELKSGKEPFLQLRPDRTTLRANGQDLCFITVEMADEDGVLCPNKNVRVTGESQGAATLQGLGSGAYCTDESYVASTNVTFDGRCLAVIRAGYEPGMAKVTVAADGFSPVSVEVAVV